MASALDDVEKQSIQLTTQYNQILTTLASAIITGLLAFYHNISQSVQVNLDLITIGLGVLVFSLVCGLMAYGSVVFRLNQMHRPQSDFSEKEWVQELKERTQTVAYQGNVKAFALLQFAAFVVGAAILVGSLT